MRGLVMGIPPRLVDRRRLASHMQALHHMKSQGDRPARDQPIGWLNGR